MNPYNRTFTDCSFRLIITAANYEINSEIFRPGFGAIIPHNLICSCSTENGIGYPIPLACASRIFPVIMINNSIGLETSGARADDIPVCIFPDIPIRIDS